jgi:hypothetical protein
LPINQRGDREGRLFDAEAAHRYVYMTNGPDNICRDVTVDAFLGLNSGPESYIVGAGVALRVDPTTRRNFVGGSGYLAFIQADRSAERLLEIYQIHSGILFGQSPPSAKRFPVEDPQENYHMRFSARGPNLTLALWRVRAIDGVIRETPVRLGNGTNVQSIWDSVFTHGVVGLSGIAWGPGNPAAHSAFFDDVTIVTYDVPPNYSSSGTCVAAVVPPSWFDRWTRLDFAASGSAATTLTVDILNARGEVLASDVRSGADLGNIPSLARVSSLQLRANLATKDLWQSPVLSDWTVTYHLPETNASESSWSEPRVSTQDNTAPVLRLSRPFDNPITVTNDSVLLEGTAFDAVSGMAGIRVLSFAGTIGRFFDAETTNGFATWHLQIDSLRPGTNLIRVTARDNAIPQNLTNATRTVVFLSPGPPTLASGPQPTLAADADARAYGSLDGPEQSLRLQIHVVGEVTILRWASTVTNCMVQTATTLWPPDWTDLPEVQSSPFTIQQSGGSRFFRLHAR